MKQVAVIGCGARVLRLMELLARAPEVEIKGGYDPVPEQIDRLPRSSGEPVRYPSFHDVVSDPEVDWVIIGSPNVWHREHILAAFDGGKHVFAEKPLATSVEECLAIYQRSRAVDLLFATGFTLRYAPIYRRAQELVGSGVLGRIVAIDANENISPAHGAYIMRSWRRNRDLSGPHILEKCVHDLDILNWLVDSVPRRVAAFGGNNTFTPENSAIFEEYPEEFDRWEELLPGNPFLIDKSIEDNVVAILQYPSGVRVQFMATMGNTIPERRMYITGTRGNLVVELYSGRLVWKAIDQSGEPTVEEYPGGGHGGGDEVIMESLANSIVQGTPPACSGREGLLSAVVALAIDEARETGSVIDLGDRWRALGVET